MKPWIKRALVGSLTACASRHQSHGGAGMDVEQSARMREKMLERMAGKLDLNADQQTRLAALADKLQAQRIALMGQGNDPRADVKALMEGDKFDAERAQALVNEKTAVVQARSPKVIAAMADPPKPVARSTLPTCTGAPKSAWKVWTICRCQTCNSRKRSTT